MLDPAPGGGGAALTPFMKHPDDPEEIESVAAALTALAREPLGLAGQTSGAHQQAVDNWEGDGAPELESSDWAMRQAAGRAVSATSWAGVPLAYWAGRVREFNRRVDAIVDARGDEDSAAVQADARQAWQSAYDECIEDGRTTTVGMIRQGPTAGNIEAARAIGLIPPASPFPDAWVRTPPPNDTITLLQFNAGGGYGYEEDDPEGMDPEDVDALARMILDGNVDIATLQEMWAEDAHALEDRLEELTGQEWNMHFGTGETKERAGSDDEQGFGNVVLVREGDGVADSNRIDLGDDAEVPLGDASEGRAIVGVDVTTETGESLNVFTTHLSTDEQAAGDDAGDTGDDERDAGTNRYHGDPTQRDQIDHVRDVASEYDGPTVVTGDFNQTPDERDSQGDLTNGAQAVGRFGEDGYTEVSDDIDGTSYSGHHIDYVFSRDGVQSTAPEEVDGTPPDHDGDGGYDGHLSDHNGIKTTIDLG